MPSRHRAPSIARPSIVLSLLAVLGAGGRAGAEEVFVAVGAGGHRMVSRDGIHWDRHAEWGKPGHDQNDLNVVTFFKGAAYAGGGFFSGRLAATRDGVHWSDGVVPESKPIFGFEVIGDAMYAVDLGGRVHVTTDGRTFKKVASATMPSRTHFIRQTAQGNGIIVGSGDFGPVIAFDPRTNEITVTQMPDQTVKKPFSHPVAFGGGVFVIGGLDGSIARTTDGVALEYADGKQARVEMHSIVWTGAEFLASAKGGGFRSQDGLTWTRVDRKLGRVVRGCNGLFYSRSWPASHVSYSQDLSDWVPMPNEKKYWVSAVAFGQLSGEKTPPPLPAAAPRKLAPDREKSAGR